MKTLTKFAALSVVAIGLIGCAENNDKAMMTGGAPGAPGGGQGVTPPSAPKSSKEAYEKFSKEDPMKKSGAAYKAAQ